MKKILLSLLLAGAFNLKNTFAQVVLPYSCDFNLGNDTSFCYSPPLNYILNGPPAFDYYLWNTGATTQNIPITTSGTYWCRGTQYSGNRIANSDFNLGNINFGTSYTYAPSGTISPGLYSIVTNPEPQNYWAAIMGDHTTGSGNMLIVDGTGVSTVWTQTITLNPNTDYNFSAWAANINSDNQYSHANLQFSINGNLLGAAYPVGNPGVWGAFNTLWNSGTNTFAVITIVDQQASPTGNDFALDDIFFEEICVYTDTINITADPMPTAQFTATPNSGLAPLLVNYTNTSTNATNVLWNFGDGNSANNINTPTNTYIAPGMYTTTLIATNNACSDTAYYSVLVDGSTSLVIPNVFTPNGDGLNDLFKVTSFGLTDFNCSIFNRWGMEMHTITNESEGWDGKSPNGDVSADGTYYYIINAKDFKGEEINEQGHLQLISK